MNNYSPVNSEEVLKPDAQNPYALVCWHYGEKITYRKRPQAKAMLSRHMYKVPHWDSDQSTPFRFQKFKLYKLENDGAFHLIFDDQSPLGYAFRHGKVTEEELKNNIQW
jgi:hypothetical protein